VAEFPLWLSETISLLNIPSEEFDSYRFFELTRSLLLPGTEAITSSTAPNPHKSFLDFITSERAGKFRVVPEEHHYKAVVNSLRHMDTHLRFNIFNLESSLIPNWDVPDWNERLAALPPGLDYACENWMYHLACCDPTAELPKECLQKFFSELFLFWLEICSFLHTGDAEYDLKDELYSMSIQWG
jgi:hypothetical protein